MISFFREPYIGDLERNLLDAMLSGPRSRPAFTPPQRSGAATGKAGATPASQPTQPFQTVGHAGHVTVDIVETADAYELVADAPGFGPEDISIELHDKVLAISAKPQERQLEQQQGKRDSQQDGKAAEPQGKTVAGGAAKEAPTAGAAETPKEAGPKAVEAAAAADGAAAKTPDVKRHTCRKLWLRERRGAQPFVRCFALPRAADRDGIAASMDRGVLTVRVPKLPSAKARHAPRRIEVQSAAKRVRFAE